MSSAALLVKVAEDTGMSVDHIRKLWEATETDFKLEYPNYDPRQQIWTKKLMTSFFEKVKELKLLHVKDHIMEKDAVKEHGQNFLNQLASNKYADAEPAFKSLVGTKLNRLLRENGKKYVENLIKK
jgi:uncharacterized protein (UPF0305 family)